MSIYDQHLDKNAANFVALQPGELRRAQRRGLRRPAGGGARRAALHLGADARAFGAAGGGAARASASGRGATVSAMLPNTPEMVEAHYAVPALNAVLNTLNTRLDAPLLAWQMNHCEAQVLITDREFAPVMARGAAHPAARARPHADRDRRLRQRIRRPGRARRRARVRSAAGRARAAATAGRPGRRMGRDRRQLHQRHHRRPQGRGHAPPRRLPERGVQRGHLDDAALPEATCGRCRCSTATAGASRGRWRCSAARTCACAASRPAPSSTAMREHGVDHYCAAPIVHNLLINAPAELRDGITQQGARHGGRRGAAGGDDRGHGASSASTSRMSTA